MHAFLDRLGRGAARFHWFVIAGWLVLVVGLFVLRSAFGGTYVNNYTGKGITTTFKFQSDGDLDPSAVAVWAYKVQGGKIVADQLAPKP